ncbi:hypothetical protein Tco_0408320 [Tanacetum coccineum]
MLQCAKQHQPTVVTDEESVKKKTVHHWLDKVKDACTRPNKQSLDAKRKSTKLTSSKKAGKGKVLKVCERDRGSDIQGEDVSNTVDLKERTVELDEAQVYVALAGPNPEPMHEDFIATVYPKVHESLKHTTEEHVFLENQPSSSKTLSSIKNLDDAFTFGDQFIDDKSPEDEPGKVL